MKGSNLKWFCSKCEQNSLNSRSAAVEVEEKVEREKKLDEIVAMLEFLVDKSRNTETTLNEKADKVELGKLETKIERIEKNIVQQSRCIGADIENRLNSLEARVLSTASRIDNFGNDYGIKDDDLIKCALGRDPKKAEETKRKAEEKKNLKPEKITLSFSEFLRKKD